MNAYVELITMGLKIFSEERRRHFQRELSDLLEEELKVKSARHPHYNDYAIKEIEKKKENFLLAYKTEFEGAVNALINLNVKP